MNTACTRAHHEPGCLNFHVTYTTEKGRDQDCTVDDVSPDIDTKVTTETRVELEVSCQSSDPDNTDNPDNTDDPDNADNADNADNGNN